MPDNSWITAEYLNDMKHESETHISRINYITTGVRCWKWYKKRAGLIPVDDFDDEELPGQYATSRDNVIKETVDEGLSIFLKNDPVIRRYPHHAQDADLVDDVDALYLSAWRNNGARSVVSSALKEAFISGLSTVKVFWDVNKKQIAFEKIDPGSIFYDPFGNNDKRGTDCRYIIHKTRQRIDVVLRRYGTEAEVALGLREPQGRKAKKATFSKTLSRMANMSKDLLNRLVVPGSGGNSDEVVDPFIDVYEYWIFPVVPNDVSLVSGATNLDDAGYPYGVVVTMIEDYIVKIKSNPFAGTSSRIKISEDGIVSTEKVKIGSMRSPFVCYDDETEVLTDRGWLDFKDLKPEDKVATGNMKKQCLEWQEPTSYITQYYEGDMVLGASKRKGANFCVTPNHQMVVYDRKDETRTWRKVDAQYLIDYPQTDYAVPTGWEENPDNFSGSLDLIPEIKISQVKFAEFLGLFLAEGYLNCGKRRKAIRITQKNKVEEVRRVIAALSVKWSEYTNKKGVVEFSICDKPLFNYLYDLCGRAKSRGKRIPGIAFTWSNPSLQALLDGMMLGDGSEAKSDEDGNHKSSATYYTSSRGLADDVQTLACLLGISSNITCTKTHSAYTGHRIDMHKVYFHQSKAAVLFNVDTRKVPYKGYVYCVTVPNETIVVRRKGPPIICGNCFYWDRQSDEEGNNRIYECMGVVEQMIPMQFNVDAMRRLIYLNMKTSAMPGGIVKEDDLSIALSAITRGPGELIPMKDTGRPIAESLQLFNGQEIPNGVFNMLESDGMKMKNRVGIRPGVSGQAPQQGTSHTPPMTIGAVQDAAFSPLWEHVKELGFALEDMSVLMDGLMQQFYKAGDFKDVSEHGESRAVEWTQRHITANFRREVVAAATTSFFDLDKMNRLSEIAAITNEALMSQNPDLIQSTINLLVNTGYPDAYDWIQQLRKKLQELQQQQQELQALGALGLSQQAEPGVPGAAPEGETAPQQPAETGDELDDDELDGLEQLAAATGMPEAELIKALSQ